MPLRPLGLLLSSSNEKREKKREKPTSAQLFLHFKMRNQEVKIGVTLLSITPIDPLAKCLPLVPTTLFYAGLEVLVPGGEMLPPGDIATIPLN